MAKRFNGAFLYRFGNSGKRVHDLIKNGYYEESEAINEGSRRLMGIIKAIVAKYGKSNVV